nr:MAG TPA: putative TetR-family transcriptional regulator regulator [Caudoviricetes sp.]
MTLYEITENVAEEAKETVTIQEAAERLNRTVGSLYGAAAEGRRIAGKYYLRVVDRTISRSRDLTLLLEYDRIRQQLIRAKKERKN